MREQGFFDFLGAPAGELGGPDYATGRDALDRYYTPPHLVDLLLDRLDVEPGHALEPFVGRAASIAGRLADHGHFVETCDVDPGAPAQRHADSFLFDWRAALPDGVDYVVTNPPFTLGSGPTASTAADAVRTFRPLARRAAAFLMRLTFFEPFSDRVDLLASDPPHSAIILPRARFRSDKTGTDSVGVAWFVWRPWVARATSTIVVSPDEVAHYEERYKLDVARLRRASRAFFYHGP